jgi:hypothetical protein
MENIEQKFDGVSVLPAAQFNSYIDELKNIITSTNQVLSAADVTQIAKAIANYVANGTFYTDSGVANAYILTVVGAKLSPTAYANGFTASFKVGNTNTGASTVNVAGLGVKSIRKNNGLNLTAGDLVMNTVVKLVYDLSNDWFTLVSTEFVAADFLNRGITNNVTVGYTTTAQNLGNSGTGTITPTIATGSIKRLTINGSFTLAAPTDPQSGYILIEATNNATGGFGITLTSYVSIGGLYNPAPNAINLFVISKVGSASYLQIIQPV